jgi:hypothetical protein
MVGYIQYIYSRDIPIMTIIFHTIKTTMTTSAVVFRTLFSLVRPCGGWQSCWQRTPERCGKNAANVGK